jgi:hypothetical protein
MALAMGWGEILWPLILGFALSAVVQAAVSHQQMSRLLPDDRPRSIATALASGQPRRHATTRQWRWPARSSARAHISVTGLAAGFLGTQTSNQGLARGV